VRAQTAPLSASVIGTASFVSKLSQSLAPMVGMAVLRGHDSGAGQEASHAGVWWMLLLLLPACVVSVQLFLWRGVFTLHGARLRAVKERLAALDDGDAVGEDDATV